MSKHNFELELKHGVTPQSVIADFHRQVDGWIIFYTKPPQGGSLEITRVRLDCIVSINTD